MESKMAATKKNVTIVNVDVSDEPENRRSSSPNGPRSPTPTASRKSSRVNDNNLWIPVAYQSISAEVQNEIDRIMTAQETRRSRRIVTTDDDISALELIEKLTTRRRQSGEYRRQISGGSMKQEKMQNSAAAQRAVSTAKPPVGPQLPFRVPKLSRTPPPTVDIVKEATSDEHLIQLDVLEKRLNTSMIRGLTEQQVTLRRVEDGPNILSPPKTTPLWLQFVKCLFGGFGIVLWAAFVLCILAYQPLGDPPDIYNIILAMVILIVILTQAIFFFTQERRSSNLMASFANLLPTYCEVIREGHVKHVDATELVVGDVVRLKAGDKVPADIRLFEVNQGKVEKSGLTGESEPIPLSVASADPNMYETKNMALFGTSMLEGTASGIVTNISDRTVMGKIAQVASGTSSVSTSLQKEVNYFTGLVAVMAVAVCVIVVVGYYAGVAPYHPGLLTVSALITNCIAVVVSLLPEGTPVALAMILTMIAKRMYTVKILVKKLTVLETLGSATLIASDKTGTLTQNRMTLKHLMIVNDAKGARPTSDEPERTKMPHERSETSDPVEALVNGCFVAKNIAKNLTEPALNYLCQIMCLCNKTVFEDDEETDDQSQKAPSQIASNRKFLGNPTEGALLKAADEYMNTGNLRQATPIVKEIAFSSRTKYHVTIHKICDQHLFQNSADAIRSTNDQEPHKFVVFMKGAPEYVLGMCSKIVVNGAEVPVTPNLISRIMKANETMASHGERVLAFAFKKLNTLEYPDERVFDTEDDNMWTTDLCFLGLAGLIDPPREGVAKSITECHNAHIRVMMITGDQPSTAVAIARSVNIITRKDVKTIVDVERSVPYSSNDVDPEITENKWLAKLKHFLKSPPKRHFRDEAMVVAGNDIGQLSNKQWDFVLEHREVIFARTTPQQKLQIVKESRKRGDVVAVTGDGVNDAPALKAADLGVAMGICGSDVSKEAANMVLLDDNFVTIVKGIKEGRLLFDNLKKVVCYLFPNGSFSEILPVLANVFLGMPLSLSTFLMIIICVGSDMIGSLGLIHEYAESDIMHRPPRNARTDRLISLRTILFAYFFVGIMESSIAFFMYFLTMYWSGGVYPNQLLFAFGNWGTEGWVLHMSPDQQRLLNCKGQTAFFVSLVMTQLWNLLSVRTRYQSIFTQKFQSKLIFYMIGEVAIVLATVYLPLVQTYMYTQPLEYYHFLIPLGLGSIILISDEIRKFFVRRYPKGIIAKLAW